MDASRVNLGRSINRRALLASLLRGSILLTPALVAASCGSSTSGVDTLGSGAEFWQNLDPGKVLASDARAPGGEEGICLSSGPHRRYYTLAQHRYAKPADWSGRPYLLLALSVAGRSAPVDFTVDFTGAANQSFVQFRLPAMKPGWREVAFSFAFPTGIKGMPDWSHVVLVRIAATKQPGRICLGVPRVARRSSATALQAVSPGSTRPRARSAAEP
jgi:hypothetical protein